MRTRNVFTLIFLLFPSFKSQSQDYIGGYIVKTNGDSLNGFIVNSSQKVMTQKIIFKTDLTQKSQEYSSTELVRFGIGKEKYTSGKIENEPYFFQLLVSGHLSLYSTYLKGLRYFVKKGDAFIKLSRESYVETLAKYYTVIGNTLPLPLRRQSKRPATGYFVIPLTIQPKRRCCCKWASMVSARIA